MLHNHVQVVSFIPAEGYVLALGHPLPGEIEAEQRDIRWHQIVDGLQGLQPRRAISMQVDYAWQLLPLTYRLMRLKVRALDLIPELVREHDVCPVHPHMIDNKVDRP